MKRLLKPSSGVVKVTRGLGQLGYGLPSKPWLIVAWKELLEAVRDRRTMINLVLLPLIIMPLVIALPTLLISPETAPPKVGVIVKDPLGEEVYPLIQSLEDQDRAVVFRTDEDPKELILSGRADLVVLIPLGFGENITSGLSAKVVFFFDPYDARASVAMGMVQGALDSFSNRILQERLKRLNVTMEYIRPVVTVTEQVTTTGEEATPTDVMMAMVLPMMIGVIAITGAGTFAIDMIAGERERRTIEALFTNPVGRGEVLSGKFVALTFLSLISGLATLLSAFIGLGLTVSSIQSVIPSGEGEALQVLATMSGERVATLTLAVLVTVMLGGLTGNALLVTAASFAKTFKEAQQYVGALTMFLLIPMIAIPYAPSSLHQVLRVLPVSSIAMFARDMLVNPEDLGLVLTSLSFSVLYLMAFLVVSSRIFARESVIFG